MQWFLLGTVILYAVVNLVIGVWNRRRITFDRYVSNPNSTGFWPLFLTLLGTLVGGGMFFAVGQLGHEAGVAGYVVGVSYLLGFLMMGILAPTLREEMKNAGNAFTLFDVLAYKYQHRAKRRFDIDIIRLFGMVNVLVFFLMLAAQFTVLGYFLRFFLDIKLFQGIITAAVIIISINVLIYGFFGGFVKDVATDIYQVVVIGVGTAFIGVLVLSPFAWSSILQLPGDYFTGTGKGILFAVGSILFLGSTFLVRFDIWQRIVAAKSDRVARYAFFAAAPLALVFFVVFTTAGMYAKTLEGSEAETATMFLIQNSFGGAVYILLIVTFFSAVISSADTFLNVAGVSLLRVLRQRAWTSYMESRNTQQGNQLLRVLRPLTLVIGVISTALAFLAPNVFNLFVGALSSLLVFTPAVIGAFVEERPRKRAALHSGLWGFVTFLALVGFMPTEAFIPGIVMAVVVYLVVRRFDAATVEKPLGQNQTER